MSKREAKKREIRYEVKVYAGEGQGRTDACVSYSYLTDQSRTGHGQGWATEPASNASHLFVVVVGLFCFF